jgi:hypothetical protein
MTDEANLRIADEITARLVAEAQVRVTRDMAELARIGLEYKITPEAYATIIANAGRSAPRHAATGSASPASIFDGRWNGLIDVYRTHERSPIHGLKHSVRLNYERSLLRLKKDIGADRIADWNAKIVKKHHEEWSADGKIAMGHELVGKVRMLAGFGATELNDDACIKLSTILGVMRFPVAKGDGSPRFTREQARALRITAREHFGWDSIALAIGLLFELPKLKQADVIGEWVPISDPAKSEIMKGSEKWIRGLRWSDLDEAMVLRRVMPSKRRGEHKEVQFRLSRSQMAMEEINRVPVAKRTGPMIICEFSGIPWSPNEFRRKLKMVAEKAGVSLGSQSIESDTEHESEAEEAS